MKVYVYAPSAIARGAIEDDGGMELPAGSALKDAVKRLEIPFLLRHLPLFTVNHRRARPDRELADGDVISFIIPVGGG